MVVEGIADFDLLQTEKSGELRNFDYPMMS